MQHSNPNHQAKLEAAKQFLGKNYVLHPEYKFDPKHSPFSIKAVEIFKSEKQND